MGSTASDTKFIFFEERAILRMSSVWRVEDRNSDIDGGEYGYMQVAYVDHIFYYPYLT